MQKQRPVNLNLFTIRFPATAIISILHRVSGVILFLFTLGLLDVLKSSLSSADSFAQLQSTLNQPMMRLIAWIFLSALALHCLAGIRHLLMDLGLGEEKKSGTFGAYLVMILSVIVIFALGIRLW